MSNPEKNTPDMKALVMSLYEENQRVFNQNNDAFYITKNLEYLARCTETDEEIPLDTLYQLAVRLQDVNGICTQPFLNEERLDGIRKLLESGLSTDRDPCLANLTPEETLNFLLSCSDDTFVYLVEETATYNHYLYGPNGTDEIDVKAFSDEVKKFKSNELKPTLAERIADAQSRAGEPAKDGMNPSLEK